MKIRLLIILIGLASFARAAFIPFDPFEGLHTGVNVSSSAIRLDGRGAEGGYLAHDVEQRVSADGVSKQPWNTAEVTDGWQALSEGVFSVELLTLNAPTIAIEGGRLTEDTVWTSEKIHVVRHWVVIPKDVSLRCESGTIVKFVPGSGIWVEDGGSLVIADLDNSGDIIFTHLADDGVGGNTDLRDAAPVKGDYRIVLGSGASFIDNSDLQVRYNSVNHWGGIAFEDVSVYEAAKTVSIPVRVSGTRNSPFSLTWETVNGTALAGEDYEAASGSLTWTKSSEGIKYIQIKILTDEPIEESETFKVRMTSLTGMNEVKGESVVTILDSSNNAENPFLLFGSAESESSTPIRIDARTGDVGKIAHGIEKKGSVDGTTWLDWDTTILTDGWQALTDGADEVSVLTLNDAGIAVEGGRLTGESTTWASDKVHLVRHWVVIPSGHTLTVTEGAIVKFLPDTGIWIEDGGTLNVTGSEDHIVVFTHWADDSVGGDTDKKEATPIYGEYNIKRAPSATLTDNGWLAMSYQTLSTFGSLRIHDVLAEESVGKVYIPVTVSGSRGLPFVIRWQAEDMTAIADEDYTATVGELRWKNVTEGTKYIEIPIIKDDQAEEIEQFKIKITLACGMNVTTSESIVTLYDNGYTTQLSNFTMNTTAQSIRVDTRDTLGGVMASGIEKQGVPDGTTYTDWNTTSLADGWQSLTSGEATKEVITLNAPTVRVEGGRLQANQTWGNTRVHMVRNWVVVPKGLTLTLTQGTIVKFTPDSGLLIEDGGELIVQGAEGADVIFTHSADDSIGGNSDYQEGEVTANAYQIIKTSTGKITENGFFQVKHRSMGYAFPSVTIHDVLTEERSGKVWVPITVSGTRKAPFSVDWEAVPVEAQLDADYTLASGTVAWKTTDERTKYIEIPIVVDDVVEGFETFKIAITTSRGTNVARNEALITLYDSEPTVNVEQLDKTLSDASPAAEVDDRLTEYGDRLFVDDTIPLRYSAFWQNMAPAETSTIQILAKMDGADHERILFRGEAGAEGVFDWASLNLDEGSYRLTHRIFDADGNILASTSTYRYLLQNAIKHGGRITADETWVADRVHVVYQTVIVASGVTLTIEPGAIVKFCEGTGIVCEDYTSLVYANGVTFSHIADDQTGGDTNLDGSKTKPTNGGYTLDGHIIFNEETDYRYQHPIVPPTVGGKLTSSQTWRGHQVYTIISDLSIPSGITLTIEPGAIIKMSSGRSIYVEAGGTLYSLGTRALPIVFTSATDDTYGGDTNEDGNKTTPQPGYWKYIRISGSASFAYSTLMYGAPRNESGIVETSGSGSLIMDNCIVAHGLYDGIWNWGGTINVRNSMIIDVGLGAAPFRGSNTYINCIFYQVNYALMYWSHWSGKPTFSNCIFNSCALGWINLGGNRNPDVDINNSLFYNPTELGDQVSDFVGLNSNIWGDPLFVNPDEWDFAIASNSPCVDAGDGNVAPELDYYGQPRQDLLEIEDTGTPSTNGTVPDIGICEVLPRSAVADVDLIAKSLVSDASVICGGEITVTWTIQNEGVKSASGSWRDKIFLYNENESKTLLAEVLSTGFIDHGGTKTITRTLSVPALAEGSYTLEILVNAYRDIYEGSSVANNVYRSFATVEVQIPKTSLVTGSILFGTAQTDTVITFKDRPATAKVMRLSSTHPVSFFIGVNFLPTVETSVYYASLLPDGSYLLPIPPQISQDSLSLVIHNETIHEAEVTIDAVYTEDILLDFTPERISNNGQSTMTLYGVGLDTATAVQLTNGAKILESVQVATVSPCELLAVFTPEKAPVGNYAVTVSVKGRTLSTNTKLALFSNAIGPKLVAKLIVPDAVRQGRMYTCFIEYENVGDVDMPAPVLQVEATGGGKIGPDTASANRVELQYVGAQQNAMPAGVLPPNKVQRISFMLSAGANNALKLYTSEDKEFFTAPWISTKDYLADLSVATTRSGMRNMSVTHYTSILELAMRLKKEEAISMVLGKVKTQYAEGASHVCVALAYMEDRNNTPLLVVTDSEGVFRFENVEKGEYCITILNPSLQEKITSRQPLQFMIDGNNDIELDAVISSGAIITGRIVNDPIETMSCSLIIQKIDEVDKKERITYSLSLDCDGNFACYGLEAGVYEVSANYNGFTYHEMVFVDAEMQIELAPRLQESGRLKGIVEGYGNSCIFDSSIHVELTKGVNSYIAYPNEDGVFYLEGIHPGEYSTYVFGSRYSYQTKDVVINAGEETTVEFCIVKNVPITGKLISFPKGDKVIVVYDGIGVTNAFATTSNECMFEGIASGNWRITIHHNDEPIYSEIFIIGDEDNRNILFEYTPSQKTTSQSAFYMSAGKFETTFVNNVGTLFWDWLENPTKEIREAKLIADMLILTINNMPHPIAPQAHQICEHNNEKYKNDVNYRDRIVNEYFDFLELYRNAGNIKSFAYASKAFGEVMGLIFTIKTAAVKLPVAKANAVNVGLSLTKLLADATITGDVMKQLKNFKAEIETLGENIAKLEADILNIQSVLSGVNTMGSWVVSLKKSVDYTSQSIRNVKSHSRKIKIKGVDLGAITEMLDIVFQVISIVSTTVDLILEIDKTLEAKDLIAKESGRIATLRLGFIDRARTFNQYHDDCQMMCPDPPYQPVLDFQQPKVPQSWDPNEMAGPLGVGENRYIKPDSSQWLEYKVYFENLPAATAAAQEVFVNAQLDPSLDWSTFEMGEVVYRNQVESGLSGKQNGFVLSDLKDTQYKVKTQVAYDEATGKVDWYLRVIDEAGFFGQWPDDPYAGFLSPNVNPTTHPNGAPEGRFYHDGEGHISYRIKMKPELADGTEIGAFAEIIFDMNAMIPTDPAWSNTIASVIDLVSFEAGTVTVAEADGEVVLTINGGSSAYASSVDVTLFDGTAKFGMDYGLPEELATSAGLQFDEWRLSKETQSTQKVTLSWDAGDTTPKTVTIPILADWSFEEDETFVVYLENATNLLIEESRCEVTITDSTVPGVVAWTQNTATGDEGTSVTLTVNGGHANFDMAVKYRCKVGSAVETDYSPVQGTLNWMAGDVLPKTITIPLHTDAFVEEDEIFTVELYDPTHATITLPIACTVTIVDTTPPPPVVTDVDLAKALIDPAYLATIKGVTKSGNTLTFAGEKGVYTLSGTVACRVVADADLTFVLDGVSLSSAEGSPIKTTGHAVTIRILDGTENRLVSTRAGSPALETDTTIAGTALTLCGNGALTVVPGGVVGGMNYPPMAIGRPARMDYEAGVLTYVDQPKIFATSGLHMGPLLPGSSTPGQTALTLNLATPVAEHQQMTWASETTSEILSFATGVGSWATYVPQGTYTLKIGSSVWGGVSSAGRLMTYFDAQGMVSVYSAVKQVSIIDGDADAALAATLRWKYDIYSGLYYGQLRTKTYLPEVGQITGLAFEDLLVKNQLAVALLTSAGIPLAETVQMENKTYRKLDLMPYVPKTMVVDEETLVGVSDSTFDEKVIPDPERIITIGRTRAGSHEMIMNHTGKLLWTDLSGKEHSQTILPVVTETDMLHVLFRITGGTTFAPEQIERALLLSVNPIYAMEASAMIKTLQVEDREIKGTFAIQTIDTNGAIREQLAIGATAEAVLCAAEKIQGPYVELEANSINMRNGSFTFEKPVGQTFFKVIIRQKK